MSAGWLKSALLSLFFLVVLVGAWHLATLPKGERQAAGDEYAKLPLKRYELTVPNADPEAGPAELQGAKAARGRLLPGVGHPAAGRGRRGRRGARRGRGAPRR